MDGGSVVAPTLTRDHALPPASDDDDAGQPMVGSTTTGDKVGLCVRDDRGRRGGKVGASAPWTAASGGGSHCR